MRKGGGKSKGSAFERWVAKKLSHWLTGGEDDKQLIRSVLSGGWSAGRFRGPKDEAAPEGWRQVGDLAPNGPVGEAFRKAWAVECKHRRDINFWHVFTAKPAEGNILGWWAKLQEEAEPAGVRPMLVFRANAMPTMVGLPVSLGYSTGHEQDLVLPAVGLHIFPFECMLKRKPGLWTVRPGKGF